MASRPSDPRFLDLGALEIERAGVTHRPGGAALGRLLSRLLISHGYRVETDELVDAVWGDRATAGSVSTLQSHLHRLRRVLEPDRLRGEAPALLVADAGGFRLLVPAEEIDSVRFAALVAEAAQRLGAGAADDAVARSEQARRLWRGRPYAPWSDEQWATAAVARLEELARQLAENLVDALLAGGHPLRALAELEPVLAAAPLRERPWQQYLLAAARAGRTEDALATYRRVDRLFREELGLGPGEELQRLHELVLAGEIAPVPSRIQAPEARPAVESKPVPAPEVSLPRQRTLLVGREHELADLLGRLDTAETITVVGGAGCGKTTLAVAGAERAAVAFDEVWFVDLTSTLDTEQVTAAIATTLEVTGEGGSAVDTLRARLRTGRTLLLLDNCEHVIDGVAELVEQLHTPDNTVVVLATSREPLQVPGEQRLDLAPLRVEDGVDDGAASPALQLFLLRYAEARPNHRLSTEEQALAAQICAHVDGVPLAIELAAARGRGFSLSEIAEQVRADPGALSRVGRGGDSGQTVAMAVERSVRLLPLPEQDLHAAMSVVPGPMTADLAAALLNQPRGDTDNLLAGLLHRSLLIAEGPLRPGRRSRFSQLAIVRAHGTRKLDHAAAERLADRRDAYVVDLVVNRPRMGMRGDAEYQDALDDDLPAVRATLRRTLVERPSWGGPALAAGLGMYWYYRGMLLEGWRWVALATQNLSRGRPVDAAILHSAQAGLRLLSQDPDGARPHLNDLFTAVDGFTADDLLVAGDEIGGLTITAIHAGDATVLELLADRAQVVAERTGDPNSMLMARAAALSARPLEPHTHLAEATDIRSSALQLGNHFIAWMVANDAIRACLVIDHLDEALRWVERSVEDNLALGARDAPRLTEVYGILHARRGDHEIAVRYLSAARAQHRRAAMTWPTRSSTTAVLEEAARRLGAAAYERAWQDGAGLHLADIPRAATAVTAPLPGRLGW